MRALLCIPLLVALGLTPGRMAAQRADAVVVGARVRVDQRNPERQSVTGFYRSRDSLSLVIGGTEAGGTLTSIPAHDIREVAVLVVVRTPGEAQVLVLCSDLESARF